MGKDKGAMVISIGYVPEKKLKKMKKKMKAEMAYGGMANGKKHMYAGGGSVTDNPGLQALRKASPEAYKKITGKGV